uniref:Uncharacterized protein n=1 Tax=Arundo donax TaxID=35708 RepID=A0A0A8YWX5_ARUDO
MSYDAFSVLRIIIRNTPRSFPHICKLS